MSESTALRIALLSYRSKPHCGGQGVYVRHLSRELVALGHTVEVFSGPPYPDLDPGVTLTRIPSLELYEEPNPFRTPHPRELKSAADVVETATMMAGVFAEPLSFSLRAWQTLKPRLAEFDIVHDNQTLGYGLLPLGRLGVPVVATVHHPISVDRRLELASANLRRKISLHRWYGFVRMQGRVARRLRSIITVSDTAYADIRREFGVAADRLRVIPLGVEADVFAPPTADRPRVPGRIVTTASADVALKGLVPLLEALAKIRTEREDAELVVVGKPAKSGLTGRTIERLGLEGHVRFVSGLSDASLAEVLGSAEVAAVPSLYEGFSLPALEAMACGTPLVATRVGAIPDVVGDAAVLVPPGDAGALATTILELLGDDEARAELGAAGRARVLERYTWRATAERTAQWYREVLGC